MHDDTTFSIGGAEFRPIVRDAATGRNTLTTIHAIARGENHGQKEGPWYLIQQLCESALTD